MAVNNRSSWTGFVLTLAAIGAVASADTAMAASSARTSTSLGDRLAKVSNALQQRANQLSTQGDNQVPASQSDLMAGFANRSGGGGWGNGRRGGWGDGRGGAGWGNVRGGGGWVDGGGGGSFVNANNPWRNGWGDGGGFINRGWPNGGFANVW